MSLIGRVFYRGIQTSSKTPPRLIRFKLDAPRRVVLSPPIRAGVWTDLIFLFVGFIRLAGIKKRDIPHCLAWLAKIPVVVLAFTAAGVYFCLVEVEVEFSDGSLFSLSAEFLRVYSPAADSKIRTVGGEKVIYGRRHVGIMCAEPVGNYGVRISFDDLHRTGIYTWDYFYHLGTNKFTLTRNYIKTLKKHGLSRDPRIGKVLSHNL